jgi:hypothetical protein
MTLRRIAPLATALTLAVTVVPAANAARPAPYQSSAVTKAKMRAVFRPAAHSVDVLFLRIERGGW